MQTQKEEPASLLWACSIFIAWSSQAAGHDKMEGTVELRHCTRVNLLWFAGPLRTTKEGMSPVEGSF